MAQHMTVTLDELLMLVGPLDESPGFDTPRERFRRFLDEHVTDAQVARTAIEQCQHAPGDQHQRALQDLVVVLGRCLGFDVRFGSYVPIGARWKGHGHWHSRRLDVVLEIRTARTQTTDLDALSRSVLSRAPTSAPSRPPRTLALCVLTPLHVHRGELDKIQTSDDPDAPVRVATLRSLLSMAEMIHSRRLTHDDFVRLLGSGLAPDFVAELLERAAGSAERQAALVTGSAAVDRPDGASFWVATIGPDEGATSEQFAEAVIGKRHILGVAAAAPRVTVRPGDGVCYLLPGKGIVGHGRIASATETGGDIRAAHRFSQVLRLQDVVLYMNAPVSLDETVQLRVRAARAARNGVAPWLTRISREEFESLTMTHKAEARRAADSTAGAASSRTDAEEMELPVTARGSHSRE